MLIFATDADVEKWMDEPLDGRSVDSLLRRASSLVQRAVRSARFAVTPAGMPEDPDIEDALRDAVCEQVTVWLENDVNPVEVASAAAPVAASSIGDASINYGDSSASNAAKDNAATALHPAAFDILANAGLTGGHLWAR